MSNGLRRKRKRPNMMANGTPFGMHRRAIDETDMMMRCHVEIDPLRRFELMGTTASAKYLGVSVRTICRWHDKGILRAIVCPENGRKQFMYTHLWVFKRLWFNEETPT